MKESYRDDVERAVAESMTAEDIERQLKELGDSIPDRTTRRRVIRETRKALSKSLKVGL